MKTVLSLSALTMALLVAGCDQGPVTPDTNQNGDGTAMEQEKQSITLKGEVLYRERIALPPNVTVRVVLEDVSLADAPSKVIAEQDIEPETQVPIPFELQYDRAAVNPDLAMGYAVRAEIRDAGNRLLWTTTERHTAEVGVSNEEPMAIMVHRVSTEEAPENVEGAGELSPAAREVQAQGARFWAIGNEPGWSLAIYPEEKLELVTDYGETAVTVPNPGPAEEGGMTTYFASSDAEELTVDIEHTDCQDDMSGQPFEYRVQVRYGDTVLNGCGQEL